MLRTLHFTLRLACALAALPALLALLPRAARAEQPPIIKATKESEASKRAALKLGLSAPFGVEVARREGKALAESLTRALGRPVEPEVLGPAELSAQLAAGKLDFAWLTALEYIEASKGSQGRVQPVVKALHAGLPFYRSVLFTSKKNRGLSNPADLKGKKLAFVSETSAAGYLIPRQLLLSAGLSELDLKEQSSFLGDHASVCRAVLDGKADAGATISNDRAGAAIAGCVETLGKDAEQLKVLATSDPIPNDVFALKPGASPEEFAQLRSALLELDKSADGKKVLADDLHADGFTAADDGDFAPLRAALH